MTESGEELAAVIASSKMYQVENLATTECLWLSAQIIAVRMFEAAMERRSQWEGDKVLSGKALLNILTMF